MTVPPPNPDLLRFLSAYAGSMVVPKRGSGKSVGRRTRITRTRNGLCERGCPALEVMIQKTVERGMMD
jgi:hypothetical protein